MTLPRVVIASNRGPVSFMRNDKGFRHKRGAGGLAGALDPVARRLGDSAVWIAAAGSDADREALSAGEVERAALDLGYRLHLLDTDPDLYARYYDDVSNRMLWFANHCLFDEIGAESFGVDVLSDWDDAYKPVNSLFAREIDRVSDPEAVVLVQDYHLSLVPLLLREHRAERTICHFTHSSFCGPAGLRHLPEKVRREVLTGLLGADLVGFHVAAWVKGFLEACAGLGAKIDPVRGTVVFDGRRTWVRAYPIAIDCESLRNRAAGDAAGAWAREFRGLADIVVARADRAEPSKNIVRGFEAWGELLEKRPDLHDRSCFIACVYPSRQSMHEYRAYAQRVETAADKINQRFPNSIRLFASDDFDRTLGALRSYDVLLVNPLMDGMNLVSKEGGCLNERDGVLVLSCNAGSFDELGEHAIPINDPVDVAETARALERAIDLPHAERRRRADALRSAATRSKPSEWIQTQLDDLEALSRGDAPLTHPA